MISTFPLLSGSNYLTAVELKEKIVDVAQANDQDLEAQVAALAVLINALHGFNVGSMPDIAALDHVWIDVSSGYQIKICKTAYGSGDGSAAKWEAARDNDTLTIANGAASDAAEPPVESGTAFPASNTKNYLFFNENTTETWVCTTTYTAALPVGERPDQYESFADSTARASATAVSDQLTDMATDTKITPQEKLVLNVEWDRIQAAKTNNIALATAEGLLSATEYLNYIAAYDSLDNYINVTSGVFDDMNVTTTVTRAAWDTAWNDYYNKEYLFVNKLQSSVSTSINSAQSEDTITEAEGRDALAQWERETAVKNNYTVQANAMDLLSDSTYTDYLAAYTVLDQYLKLGGSPALDLENATYPIDLTATAPPTGGADWISRWNAYYEKERPLNRLFTNTLKDMIDGLGDDGVISAGTEKRNAIREWLNIKDVEYALLVARATEIEAIDASITTEKDSYIVGYTELEAYIDTLDNFLSTTIDTPVDDADWDDAWTRYFDRRTILNDKIVEITNTRLITYGTNQEKLDNLLDDGKFTAGAEKRDLIMLYDQIKNEYAVIIQKATVGTGTDTTDYTAKYDTLMAYLIALSSGGTEVSFKDVDEELTIPNTSIYSLRFSDYYYEREALERAILDNIYNSTNRDSVSLPEIATDGIVTVAEKALAKSFWDVINGNGVDGAGDDAEHNNLKTQAIDLGVAAPTIAAFNLAYATLEDYLFDNSNANATESLSLFDNMTIEKALTANEQTKWIEYWNEYYVQRDVIQGAITTSLNTQLNALLDLAGTRPMTGTMTHVVTQDFIGNDFVAGGTVRIDGTPSVGAEAPRRDQTVLLTEKAATNGVATLDSSTLIPIAQVPPRAVVEVDQVTTIIQRDALTSTEGDWCHVSDTKLWYLKLNSGWATTTIHDENVRSVNGHVGPTVTVTKSDVSLGNVTDDAQLKASQLQTTITDDDTKVPSSGAVVDYVAASGTQSYRMAIGQLMNATSTANKTITAGLNGVSTMFNTEFRVEGEIVRTGKSYGFWQATLTRDYQGNWHSQMSWGDGAVGGSGTSATNSVSGVWRATYGETVTATLTFPTSNSVQVLITQSGGNLIGCALILKVKALQ